MSSSGQIAQLCSDSEAIMGWNATSLLVVDVVGCTPSSVCLGDISTLGGCWRSGGSSSLLSIADTFTYVRGQCSLAQCPTIINRPTYPYCANHVVVSSIIGHETHTLKDSRPLRLHEALQKSCAVLTNFWSAVIGSRIKRYVSACITLNIKHFITINNS